MSALMFAAEKGHALIAQMLINEKANLDYQDTLDAHSETEI